MSESNDDEIVCVARGTLVQIEIWQQALSDAGIESNVVGDNLASSFGTAMPDSIELWVHHSQAEAAQAAIARSEQQAGH